MGFLRCLYQGEDVPFYSFCRGLFFSWKVLDLVRCFSCIY